MMVFAHSLPGRPESRWETLAHHLGPSPDHSTAGARVAAERYRALDQSVFGRLIAFAVAGHHAGLADGSGVDAASLDSRLGKTVPSFAGWEAHVANLPERLSAKLPFKAGRESDPAYSLAFLGRMLFSCLVDAGFLATESFYAEPSGSTV